jgi:gliding motility-associated-like protein
MTRFICILFLYFKIIYINAQPLSIELTKYEAPCELGKASVTIFGSNNYFITWSIGSHAHYINELNAGDYSVNVQYELNKDTIMYFTIKEMDCEPIAENHFTPNNDDYNDTWDIARIEKFPDFELFVYNRWGQQVHHQTKNYIPWDGRSLNLPLPDAAYYYVIYLSKEDKSKFIKGNVNIIR